MSKKLKYLIGIVKILDASFEEITRFDAIVGKEKMIVVAGVIVKELLKEEFVLIGLRKKKKVHGGYWEFPGGKVEAGESNKAALKREINEELELDILVADFIGGKNTEGIDLQAYYCSIINPNFDKSSEMKITSSDHDELRWVKRSKLSEYFSQLAPADRFLLPLICS